MAFVTPEVAAAYQEAWQSWQKQLEHVHRVFLEDEKIRPEQIKGLLNREARAKENYDKARARLLGLDTGDVPSGPEPSPGGGNPFR